MERSRSPGASPRGRRQDDRSGSLWVCGSTFDAVRSTLSAKEGVMANKDKGGSKAQKKAGKTLKEKRAAKKEKAQKGSRGQG
jgi:hypothetical protein